MDEPTWFPFETSCSSQFCPVAGSPPVSVSQSGSAELELYSLTGNASCPFQAEPTQLNVAICRVSRELVIGGSEPLAVDGVIGKREGRYYRR